jgi:hypothetical protein
MRMLAHGEVLEQSAFLVVSVFSSSCSHLFPFGKLRVVVSSHVLPLGGHGSKSTVLVVHFGLHVLGSLYENVVLNLVFRELDDHVVSPLAGDVVGFLGGEHQDTGSVALVDGGDSVSLADEVKALHFEVVSLVLDHEFGPVHGGNFGVFAFGVPFVVLYLLLDHDSVSFISVGGPLDEQFLLMHQSGRSLVVLFHHVVGRCLVGDSLGLNDVHLMFEDGELGFGDNNGFVGLNVGRFPVDVHQVGFLLSGVSELELVLPFTVRLNSEFVLFVSAEGHAVGFLLGGVGLQFHGNSHGVGVFGSLKGFLLHVKSGGHKRSGVVQPLDGDSSGNLLFVESFTGASSLVHSVSSGFDGGSTSLKGNESEALSDLEVGFSLLHGVFGEEHGGVQVVLVSHADFVLAFPSGL